MILLLVQNKKDYYMLLSSEEKLKLYLICPCCNSYLFISWSCYPRKSLPKNEIIIIHRIRCSSCKTTHALLPAFLFGKIRHTNETIAPYVEVFTEEGTTINRVSQHQQVPQAPKEISTLYTWFKRLNQRCKELLPLLQEELKKLNLQNILQSIIKDNDDSDNHQIQKVYYIAKQLTKLSQQYDCQGKQLSPLIFLNYFYWEKTGQPLLSVVKLSPT